MLPLLKNPFRDGRWALAIILVSSLRLAAQAPSAVSITPSTGTGSKQQFTFVFSDPAGWANIQAAQLLVGPFSQANSCYLYATPGATGGTLYLAADSGSFGAPLTVGVPGIQENSQCVLDAGSSSASVSGSNWTVNVTLLFKPAFAANWATRMWVSNISPGLNTGWVSPGSNWTATTDPALTDVSLGPSSGTGASATLTEVYYDTSQGSDISRVWTFLRNGYAASPTDHACYAHWEKASNQVQMVTDAGYGFGSGVVVGTPGATLSNSQCTLDVAHTTVSTSGNSLTITLPFTFTPSFAGAQQIWMSADNGTQGSGWHQLGTWTVTSSTVPITIATAPSGLAVTVDGGSCTLPCSQSWMAGSGHTIAVNSPQAGATGTQYVFSNWSDGGAQSHSVAPTSATTYTANFTTQYYLTTSASAGGAISPGSGWYNSGAVASVSATPSSGYQFTGFSGSLSGTTTPQNLTMNSPASVAANFTASTSGPAWYNAAWSNRKKLIIDHTKVSGSTNLTSFPVLFSVTDANLKTVANGGSVGQANGNDILFTASDGVTKLNHEIETYNGATGQLIAWVQVPTVLASADTVIYTYYGNGSAANQQNATGVWDSNYKGVWHLANGTTLSATDSTSNGNNGTISGATPSSGIVDGSASFDGTSNIITIPNRTSWSAATPKLSIELWVKVKQIGDYKGAFAVGTWANQSTGTGASLSSGGGAWGFAVYTAGGPNSWGCGASSAPLSYLQTVDNKYHHVVITMDATVSQCNLYSDGQLIATDPYVDGQSALGTSDLYFGGFGTSNLLQEELDEFRFSNINRSAGWIGTEYNNQSAPGTFVIEGAQETNIVVPPISVSVSPSSGSGSAQTFTFTFSDPNGGANIRSTQMDIGAALAQPGTCYLFYDRGGHAIYLSNDAGATGAAYPLGVAGTTSNSQCTVDAGASSASTLGNNLTVNLALTFKAAFAGAKNVYAMADNGAPSAWAQLGAWTVPGAGDFTISVAQSPLSGDPGAGVTYTVNTAPVNGFTGSTAFSFSGPSGFSGSFNPLTAAVPGSTQFTLNIPMGTAPTPVATDTTPAVPLPFTITGTSGSLLHSVGAAVGVNNKAPSADSVSPSSGSGSAQVFTFVFSDINGATDIDTLQLLFRNTSGAGDGYLNACNLWINRGSSSIQLRDDAITSWGSPIIFAQAGTLHNSQCGVDSSGSSMAVSGVTLTVNLAITFQPVFAGLHNITMEAVDLEGLGLGLPPTRGTWTVPTVLQPDFSLSVSPTSQAGVGGGTVPYTVSTAFLNGFNSTVTFSVSGLPNTFSRSFSPASLSASGSTTLTVGIPIGAASTSFTITATGGGLTRSIPASVAVTPPVTVLTNQTLATGTELQPYSQSLAATGGQPPYTWSIALGSGPLPGGLYLNGNGVLSTNGGTLFQGDAYSFPPPNGSPKGYVFTIHVVDSSSGANAARDLLFAMTVSPAASIPPLLITTSASEIKPGAPGQPYPELQFSGTGGVGAYNWSVVSGALPSGMDPIAGPVGKMKGTVSQQAPAGIYNFSLKLIDSSNPVQSDIRPFSVTISNSTAPDFTINGPSNSPVGIPGGSVSFIITLTAMNGYTGTETLSVTGLPAGITSRGFNPPTIPGSGSTTLTLDISPGMALGTTPSFSISATDGAGLSHSLNASINVETAPPIPSKEYIRLGNRVIAIENH